MASPVSVANLALDSIGAGYTVSSLTPPLPAPNAAVVARHYDITRQSVGRAAHWNCLRRQAKLTVLKAAQGTPFNPDGTTLPIPPYPWLYEYALPDDYLTSRYLLFDPPPSTGTAPPIYPPAAGVIQWSGWGAGYNFVIGIDTDASNNQQKILLTDLIYADLVYTADILNPDLWDSQFLLAVAATLGAYLVNPVNMNMAILKAQVEIAQGLITAARVSDGLEGTTTSDIPVDWMEARGRNQFGIGPPGMGQAFYGWNTIAFPGGLLI